MNDVSSAPGRYRSDRVKRVMFIGFVAPATELENVFSKEAAPQVSAAKFQLSFLQGLVALGVEIEVLSALPIAAFPKSRIRYMNGRTFSMFDGKVRGRLMGGINAPMWKLVSRFLKAPLLARRIAAETPPDAIIVYSLHSPFLLAALALKRLTGAPLVVFMPDLPMHMHGLPPSGIHGWLKRADNALLKKLVQRFDLALPFTKAIGQDWLPEGICLQVVDGIAPPSGLPLVPYKMQNPGRPKLIYTGSFTEIGRFAEMFSECRDIEADLTFAGEGADRRRLETLSLGDSRIQVFPFLEEGKLAELIASADFLLNPRDSRWEGGRYSFPSKLLDYVYRSKPIITTRLPGIDEEYFDYFLAIDDENKVTLRNSLTEVLSLDESELRLRVQETREFFDTHKSAEAIAAKVIGGIVAL